MFVGKQIGQSFLRYRCERDDLNLFQWLDLMKMFSMGGSRSTMRKTGTLFWSGWMLWLLAQKSKKLFHELMWVLKVSVDRCESNIGDPIEELQFLHDQLSYDP